MQIILKYPSLLLQQVPFLFPPPQGQTGTFKSGCNVARRHTFIAFTRTPPGADILPRKNERLISCNRCFHQASQPATGWFFLFIIFILRLNESIYGTREAQEERWKWLSCKKGFTHSKNRPIYNSSLSTYFKGCDPSFTKISTAAFSVTLVVSSYATPPQFTIIVWKYHQYLHPHSSEETNGCKFNFLFVNFERVVLSLFYKKQKTARLNIFREKSVIRLLLSHWTVAKLLSVWSCNVSLHS